MKLIIENQTYQELCIRRNLQVMQPGGPDTGAMTVKDPVSDRFYRFGPVEWFIIQNLDGKSTPADVQRKVGERFGADLDRETLDAFVQSLDQRGLLETADSVSSVPTHDILPRRRLGGNLLYMRFRVFDPDRKLDWLVGHVGFCFTRRFVVASAWLIVLALLTFLLNSDEIGRDFLRVFQPGNIIPALIIILATTIGHEFAHGLTCKHFGGQVHEMGFLLLFFQPALYCNVSDAWLFPKKSKRMWVGIAGTYFELVLWALAVFVWRITAPETAFNFTALVILGVSGFRLFLNLNPLIKLDGYYVLGDWLEIPNLRARAFAFVRVWARRPWSMSHINLPPREKRIYLWYGLLAMVFTVWILSFITTLVAGFLTDQLQGIGFILFICILVVIFKAPLTRLKAKMIDQRNIRAAAPGTEK